LIASTPNGKSKSEYLLAFSDFPLLFLTQPVLRSFITFEDLHDLLGGCTESEALEQIWRDSLQECKAHLERITFDDFKMLMKGQPKERRGSFPPTGLLLAAQTCSSSRGHEPSPLEAVPEGERKVASEHPEEISKREGFAKVRSRSYEQKATVWDQSVASMNFGEEEIKMPELERDASLALVLPGKVSDEVDQAIRDPSMSPLVVNRSLYRKHREMRLAVLDASKQFDKKRNDIRNKPDLPAARASLIMKRGQRPPVELEDAHTRALFEAAAKRCGRSRRTRNKTVSDVTGMIITPSPDV